MQPSARPHYNDSSRSLRARSIWLCVWLCVSLSSSLLSGCGHSPPAPPSATPDAPADDSPRAPLTLQATPPNPMIWVDGLPRGSLSKLSAQTLLLPIGRRRLELRADGYYPHRADITLHPEQPLTLQITLTPRLD